VRLSNKGVGDSGEKTTNQSDLSGRVRRELGSTRGKEKDGKPPPEKNDFSDNRAGTGGGSLDEKKK